MKTDEQLLCEFALQISFYEALPEDAKANNVYKRLKHEILFKCMDKLIDNGWTFDFNENTLLIHYIRNNLGVVMFKYNNDKLSALQSAILYALQKEGE